jgi:hypothetical protein
MASDDSEREIGKDVEGVVVAWIFLEDILVECEIIIQRPVEMYF